MSPVTASFPGAVTHLSTGVYGYNFTAPAAGVYSVLWTGAGSINAVTEYEVDFRAPATPWLPTAPRPTYASLNELRTHLQSDPDDTLSTTDDAELLRLLEAATTKFEMETNRLFYAIPGDVRYYGSRDGQCLVVDDVLAVTELACDQDGNGAYETILPASAYKLSPTEAPYSGEPYTEIRLLPNPLIPAFPTQPRGVRVTGDFGYNATGATPALVTTAVLLSAGRLYARKQSLTGVQSVFDARSGMPSELTVRADADYAAIVALFCREAVPDEPPVYARFPSTFTAGYSRWRQYGRLV
jgi:hypothetical protein